MNVKLYLDKPESDESVIMLYVSFNGSHVRLSTGLKIKKSNCIVEGRTRITKIKNSFMHAKEYNTEINRIVSFVNSYIVSNNNKGLLSKEKFVEDYKNYISPYTISDADSTINLLIEYLDVRLNYSNGIKRINPLSKTTSRRIKYMVNNLISFVNANPKYGKIKSFNDIKIVYDFTEWLYKYNNTPATITVKLGFVKQFIDWVINEKDINVKSNIKFNYVNNENLSLFALNLDEITLIKNATIDSQMLDYYRCWFLVQCYTGLRYCDLILLNRENIKLGERIIWLNTIKTNKIVQIPIIDDLYEIITSNDDLLFNTKRTNYNSYKNGIKKVAKLAGLNELVPKVSYNRNVKVIKTFPKYELIGTHTARRTFITMSIKKRIPDRVIMQVSGHTSYKSFNKYIKLANEDVKKEFFEAYNKKDID